MDKNSTVHCPSTFEGRKSVGVYPLPTEIVVSHEWPNNYYIRL